MSAYVPMTHEEKMAIDRRNCILSHSQTAVVDATEQAVLARIESQGLVIVPREPTRAMCLAGALYGDGETEHEDIGLAVAVYKAMLEATKEST
jgi:hypothetical protein